MSYKPTGVSIPTAFSKTRQNSGRRQPPRDRLVEVTEISPNKDSGFLTVRELGTDRVMEVRVKRATFDRLKSKVRPADQEAPEWVGWNIDERMAKVIQPGAIIILEGCLTTKNQQTPNGQVSLVECDWVHNVRNPEPEKTFRANITAYAYQGRIQNVQAWDEQGLDVKANKEGVEQLANELNEQFRVYQDNEGKEFAEREPFQGRGVKFRALVENGVDANGKPTYQVIDTTPSFEWVSAERDSNNQIIKKGHPIDGDRYIELLNGYLDYIYGPEDNPSAAKFADGQFEGKPVRVEVLTCRTFAASEKSASLTVPDFGPLRWLVSTPTKCALDDSDDEAIIGKNYAVNGILMLTGDKRPESRNDTWKPRNLVTRIFANGFNGPLDNLVRAFDGGTCRVHDALRVAIENQPQQSRNQDASSPQPQQPAAPAGPTLTPPATDPFAGTDDGDPFAAALESAPPAPAPAPAAPPAGGSRLRSR